jgi:hypothetical protein
VLKNREYPRSPINFEGVFLYPVTVSQINLFKQCSAVLQIDPLELPDIKFQAMSRLRFILETFRMLEELIRMVLGDEQEISLQHPTDRRLDGKILHITRRPSQTDQGVSLVLTPKLFDDFRRVVLIQNGIDISEEEVDPVMRRVYNEDMVRLQRAGQTQSGITEEDRLDLMSLHNRCLRSELGEMPLREYILKTDRLLTKEIYQAQLNGQMTGFVKFKKEPRHWLIRQTNKEKILSHFRTEDDVKGLLNEKS